MTEFPPAPGRVDPPYRDGERDALAAWLEFHRATLLAKCAGLTAKQLSERSVPPSPLSLRGLVRHMTEVEVHWFRRVLEGEDVTDLYCTPDDPDRDFTGVDPMDADDLMATEMATLAAEQERSRRNAAGHELDDLAVTPRRTGERASLRWIYLHMIEEYARHNGHADLLRERIDGAVGD